MKQYIKMPNGIFERELNNNGGYSVWSKASMDSMELYELKKMDDLTVWLLHLFLGWSYGSFVRWKMQTLFYLTFGGCGLWYLYRCLTLQRDIDDYNIGIALECGVEEYDLYRLGL